MSPRYVEIPPGNSNRLASAEFLSRLWITTNAIVGTTDVTFVFCHQSTTWTNSPIFSSHFLLVRFGRLMEDGG
jgi:hypothetical protein